MGRDVAVELLVVPDCPHEQAVRDLIQSALADSSVQNYTIARIVITSENDARHRGFIGSPTILVNGRDPFAQPAATPGLACRIYATPSGARGVPALRDLRRALTEAQEASTHEYRYRRGQQPPEV